MLFNYEELNKYTTPTLNTKRASVALDEAVHPSTENFSCVSDVNMEFDIFLSYSSRDSDIIIKLAHMLQRLGHSVYLDRLNDPQLDSTNVTRETAECLRNRLNHSKALFYAASISSQQSKWMPWEAGYMDARNGRVAILPIADNIISAKRDIYHGQEYLSLYPYISKEASTNSGKPILWTNETNEKYCSFSSWLNGAKPILHSH